MYLVLGHDSAVYFVDNIVVRWSVFVPVFVNSFQHVIVPWNGNSAFGDISLPDGQDDILFRHEDAVQIRSRGIGDLSEDVNLVLLLGIEGAPTNTKYDWRNPCNREKQIGHLRDVDRHLDSGTGPMVGGSLYQ